jgi:hypothetical protein
MKSSGLRTAAVAAAIVSLLGITAPAEAKPGGVAAIPLNTEQEVTGSNTGASGFFSYSISGTQFCYTLTARDLSVPATAAHVHVGPRNVAGPIVIHLEVGTGTTWSHMACTTVTDAIGLAALAGIQTDPRSYYVNVHTPTFPGGEIRGQLK